MKVIFHAAKTVYIHLNKRGAWYEHCFPYHIHWDAKQFNPSNNQPLEMH